MYIVDSCKNLFWFTICIVIINAYNIVLLAGREASDHVRSLHWYILSVHLERKWKERKTQGVRGVALHFCPINLTQRWEPQENQAHRT